jgi:hypothetical protein
LAWRHGKWISTFSIIRVRAAGLLKTDPLGLCFPFDDDENEEAIACLWQFEVRVDVLVLTCRQYA